MKVNAINNVQYTAKKANRVGFGQETANMTTQKETKKPVISPSAKNALVAGVVGLATAFLVRRGAAETSILLDNAGKLTDRAATHAANTIKGSLVASQMATGALIAAPIINLIDKLRANKAPKQ